MATGSVRPGAIAARQVVKRTLDRHSRLLKNNRLYYELERARAYRNFQVHRELTDRHDLLDELIANGVVVIEGFLSPGQAQELLQVAEDVLAGAQAGELDEYVFTTQPDILFRIGKLDHVAPATGAFFNDPTVSGLVRAYMSPRAASYRRELDYRFGQSKVAQADLYHFDNWRPICKAFLYLNDVGENQAPFVYVPGSHRLDPWRRRHNVTYDADGPRGRFGHFFPQEIKDLRAQFGWRDLVCTGEAGTLILADLRGLHRGTPLREGRRVMLTNAFDLMSPGLKSA